MPSTDDEYDQLNANNDQYGGGGGGYLYDPTLTPGYYNVMGDPLAGDSTDPGGYYPGDNGVGPGMMSGDPTQMVDPNSPGFTSTDAYGNPIYVNNPGYDPGTINNLPTINPPANVNPDPTGGEYDPTGGSGNPGDPYNLGENTPVFQGGTTQQGPTDPTIPNPPAVSNPPIPQNPIGPGLPTPYPPPGTFTTGQSPTPTPTRGTPPPVQQPVARTGGTPPPSAKTGTSAPTPSPNINLSTGGMPGISSTLPGTAPFTYKPIGIARQGAPNVNVPPLGQGAPPTDGPGGNVASNLSPLNPYSRLMLDQQQQKQKSPYDSGL